MAWPSIVVEIGFATSNPLTAHASTTWSDVTADVIAFTTRRGRSDALARVEAGTATVTLDNTDRKYDNKYIAGVYYPNVKPMRKLRIKAVYSAVTYYLFTGYIEDWPLNYGGGLDSTITIKATDAFKFFALKKLNGAYSNEYTNFSIDTWLTNIAWPAADRQLNTGQSQIQSGTFVNVPALTHFQNCAEVESGLFFMDGQGRATFHGRHYRLTGGSAVVANFNDFDAIGTTGELFWRNVTVAYSDANLWNEARVTRTGGTEQVATDTTSSDEFFVRTYTRNLPILTDNEALSLAQWIVSRYGQPKVVFTSMTLDGLMDEGLLWQQMLGREISDRINVKQFPPIGITLGTTISMDCYIEGVQHDMSVAGGSLKWDTTFLLSSADVLQYWVLQDAVLGILDSTTRLAY